MSIPLNRKLGLYLPVAATWAWCCRGHLAPARRTKKKIDASSGGWLAMQGLGASAGARDRRCHHERYGACHRGGGRSGQGPPSDLNLNPAYKHVEEFLAAGDAAWKATPLWSARFPMAASVRRRATARFGVEWPPVR